MLRWYGPLVDGSARDEKEGTMTCQKCNGLMVEEWRPEFTPESYVQRCLNCGLLLDPVIAARRSARARAKEAAISAA